MQETDIAAGKARTALILASASPRRQELIALLGLPFSIVPSRYEEPAPPTSPIDLPALVTTLAMNKGLEVAQRKQAEIAQGMLVVGADTLVTVADADIGIPLGKPRNTEEARQMLRQLSGRTHRVYTGIAVIAGGAFSEQAGHDISPDKCQPSIQPDAFLDLLHQHNLVLKSAAVCTRVRFRALSDLMIANYVATGEPMDKAGSYGAQGYAAPFIESFEGDFFNVVGLPLCKLAQMLESMGVSWGME